MRADNSSERTLAARLRRREAFRVAAALIAFAAVFCAVLSSAWAGTLVDFIPAPASPGGSRGDLEPAEPGLSSL